MLIYLDSKTIEPKRYSETHDSIEVLQDANWIDLFSPSKAEEEKVEQLLGQDLPSREQMGEIELSSRLYKENDAFFMTAMILAQSDSPDPKLEPVTFILTQKKLITIRYIDSQSFKLFISQVKKIETIHQHALGLLISILEAVIDRLADILECVGNRLDNYSKTILRKENTSDKLDYRKFIQHIGVNGDLNSKARESLITFNRLISFFGQMTHRTIDQEEKLRLAALRTDIASLSDHANFLSTKVNFLLDATLGMVNIEQNNIIKIFSVAAVIFLPPNLVASIYGMNFHFMPELAWKYGYLLAFGLILTAAWLPYKYFKYRKWL